MLKIEWKVLRIREHCDIVWASEYDGLRVCKIYKNETKPNEMKRNETKRNKASEFFNRSCPHKESRAKCATRICHCHCHCSTSFCCISQDGIVNLPIYDCLQLIVALALPTMLCSCTTNYKSLSPLYCIVVWLCFTLAYFSIYCSTLKQ